MFLKGTSQYNKVLGNKSHGQGYVILEPYIAPPSQTLFGTAMYSLKFLAMQVRYKSCSKSFGKAMIWGYGGPLFVAAKSMGGATCIEAVDSSLKKFGILSAQRARIGIKPFIPASQKTHSLFRLVSPAHTSRQRQTRRRRLILFFFPESVRAKGSSNSPGLLHIFTSSQLLIYSYLHKSSSYLQICTGRLHIFTSSLHHM